MYVQGAHPKDVVCLRPKKEYKDKFVNALFNVDGIIGYRIPFEAIFPGGAYAMSKDDAKAIKDLGIEVEYVEVIDLGSLPLEERNAIKKRSIESARANRDRIKARLSKKYGIRQPE